jgi:formate C-acetyltransferase
MERARLLTEFYNSDAAQNVSIPVGRALAFKYLLEHKELWVGEGELIVGERGPEPKATPTYPEICAHSLDDLEILNNREKVWFRSGDEEREFQSQTVLPFWSERSIRANIFKEVDRDWIDAYEAGVFTEFQEQRAPGHTVLDDKIYRLGMDDFSRTISERLDSLDATDDDVEAKREQLKAMAITTEALVLFAGRYADKLKQLAEAESNPNRKRELAEMSSVCSSIPKSKPETLHEALQYYWFVHLGVITELNTWDSFNPGRLDQHLWPFYERDIESGRLTEESARELLGAFWIKFNNQPAPPKVGVTAAESATYTDFCLINLGGLTETGEDAVNDLTYVLLDIIEEMRILQPSSMVQVSKRNPDRLLKRALKILGTGFGQPSLFNSDAIVQELLRQGKSIEDARNGGSSGCVETGAFGKEAYILTGYFNLVKVLEVTLYNGVDPRTGKTIGVESGDPATLETFDDLYAAFEKQLKHFIDIKIRGNLIVERLWSEMLPAPFMSVLIDDCIANARDYNSGGARYNTSYIQGVGMGTITDSLTALKFHVFEQGTLSLPEFIAAAKDNFANDTDLHRTLRDDTPKYGNDNDHADDQLRRVFESYFAMIDGRPNYKGGHFRINLLPTTCHVYFGSVVGATPDGRLCGEPLSEGISPVQGADRKGPTAVLKSAAKIDHLRTGGTLLNQKFTPELFENDADLDKIVSLVRAYFRMNGHHVQFNVVTAETLRRAQREPEKHRDLIVRVAGYSDYFCDLGPALQNEIIKRTEQTA